MFTRKLITVSRRNSTTVAEVVGIFVFHTRCSEFVYIFFIRAYSYLFSIDYLRNATYFDVGSFFVYHGQTVTWHFHDVYLVCFKFFDDQTICWQHLTNILSSTCWTRPSCITEQTVLWHGPFNCHNSDTDKSIIWPLTRQNLVTLSIGIFYISDT